MPTNAGVKKTVSSLLRKGVRAENLVWLISSQQDARVEAEGMVIAPTRVDLYRHQRKHQVYVGAPHVLARLFQSVDHMFILPPLIVIVRNFVLTKRQVIFT